jgi:hypothetical protein
MAGIIGSTVRACVPMEIDIRVCLLLALFLRVNMRMSLWAIHDQHGQPTRSRRSHYASENQRCQDGAVLPLAIM